MVWSLESPARWIDGSMVRYCRYLYLRMNLLANYNIMYCNEKLEVVVFRIKLASDTEFGNYCYNILNITIDTYVCNA